MIRTLPLMLLIVTPLYGAPELTGSLEPLDHHSSASSAESGEHHKHLELEDAAEWSASTEVLDDNHAWFQRSRRSMHAERKPMKVEDIDDLEAAESVVFMPAHMRQMKKMAFQDCRQKHQDRKSWRSTNPSTSHQVVWECNAYCCYPLVRIN